MTSPENNAAYGGEPEPLSPGDPLGTLVLLAEADRLVREDEATRPDLSPAVADRAGFVRGLLAKAGPPRSAAPAPATVPSGKPKTEPELEPALAGFAAGAVPTVTPSEFEDLWRRAVLERDQTAAAELVRRGDRMFLWKAFGRTGHWSDAEDVMMDTWMALFRAGSSLAFRTEFEWWRWMTKEIYGKCVDLQRTRGLRRTPLPSDLIGSARDPSDVAASAEGCDRIRAAIDTLGESDREILLAYVMGGLTSEEIGSQVGLSASTVRSRVYRARQRLAASLQLFDPSDAEVNLAAAAQHAADPE